VLEGDVTVGVGAGAGGGGGGGGCTLAEATAAVAADVEAAEPFRFVAVTTTRRVALRSADERLAVDEVAPAIALQLAPPESQRSHW
jgi:hypothetical protein